MDKAKSENRRANLGEVTNSVYSLLHDLESEDRVKIMNSVAQLYGDPAPLITTESSDQPAPPAGRDTSRSTQHAAINEQQYFASKAPQNKGEMLAVAARYREVNQKSQSHTSADFAKFFSDARQNFDRHNFQRDISNAQRQAQLFNLGTPKGQYQLSYYGQQFVDALPNREAVKKIRRSGRKGAKKKTKPSAAK